MRRELIQCVILAAREWNLVEERIAYTNGTSTTIRYHWGKDLSGTIGGAGGVGGLIYLTISNAQPSTFNLSTFQRSRGTRDSSTPQLYIPYYDNNGNILGYRDAQGNVVASYTYDAFGNIIDQSGAMVDAFSFRFSTKYFDSETGLYYYGYRYYSPVLMRWLNRDPLEEDGGVNLYAMCGNRPVDCFDSIGTDVYYMSITIKRKHLRMISAILDDIVESNSDEDYWGHWWIEFDEESYGWWPSRNLANIKDAMKGVPGDLNGRKAFGGTETRDPYHGKVSDEMFHPRRKETDEMRYGEAKGKKCQCATEEVVKDCIRKFAKSYSGEWRWPVKTCQTFQLEAMSNCCLER